jgi:hypothetical protein
LGAELAGMVPRCDIAKARRNCSSKLIPNRVLE